MGINQEILYSTFDKTMMRYRKKFLIVGVPLFIAFLSIARVFLIPDCFAFDFNDDANHTFVNLHVWRSIFLDGQWPVMNVFNNFGTPLAGDVLTYPLSPLAVTYSIFPDIIAMTINRFLVAFLTSVLLMIYFLRRLPDSLSVLATVFIYFTPAFFWHASHHHFQMTYVLFIAIILLQENFNNKPSMRIYLVMCVLSLLMFFSISINVVLIMCLFIAVHQFLLSDNKIDRNMRLTLSALFFGFLVSLPDTMMFLQAMTRSIRRFAEYPTLTLEGPNKIFWSTLVAAYIFVFNAYTQNIYKFERKFILYLGVIPTLIIPLLKIFPYFWRHIPLLGATDYMRLTWLANIFLIFGVCLLILHWEKGKDSGWWWQIILCFMAISQDIFWSPVITRDWYLPWRWIIGIGFSLLIAIVLVLRIRGLSERLKSTLNNIFKLSLLIAVLYYSLIGLLRLYDCRTCRLFEREPWPYFSAEGTQEYQLKDYMDKIKPYSRIAYDFGSSLGYDTRGAKVGVFGSGARSTVMSNSDFAMSLYRKGLIKFDNFTGDYHFTQPWQAHELQRLGISYVAQEQRNDYLKAKGWELIVEEDGMYLYKNPLPASVVYLRNNKGIMPVAFKPEGNGLNIKLPKGLHDVNNLVITLLNLPGWQATVDGKSRPFLKDREFLTLPVQSKDQLIRIRYCPYFGWRRSNP